MSCSDHLPPVDLARVSATSILSGEHRVILQVLAVLEKLAAIATGIQHIPTDHANQVLEVLTKFADRCHHGKEETILFPMLESIQPGFGPVQVMLAEHVDGRAFISAMKEAVVTNDAARYAQAATGYVELLRQHIAKEDDILFRLADHMLTPAQDAEILEAYRRIEHDDMGDGTHERLLGIADTLASTYHIPRASDNPQIMDLLTAICGCKKG